jgi:aldehyde:ferredoxin oxidoreductase
MAGERAQSIGKGEPAAKYQALKDLFDTLLLCKMSPATLTQMAEALNAITGWSFSPIDLYTCGERSLNIKRAINNKLGVTRKDDKMPGIAARALAEGSSMGVAPDMDTMLRDYYSVMKWDWNTGKPTKDRLIELGLHDVARDLWP